MTWLTVPGAAPATPAIQPHSRSYFPHMARAKVVAIIPICIVLPSKKLRNVKAKQKNFKAGRKNNILSSLRDLSLAGFNASAYIILPISDISQMFWRFFDRPRLAVLERLEAQRQEQVQVEF